MEMKWSPALCVEAAAAQIRGPVIGAMALSAPPARSPDKFGGDRNWEADGPPAAGDAAQFFTGRDR